jgi:hypothetical protein
MFPDFPINYLSTVLLIYQPFPGIYRPIQQLINWIWNTSYRKVKPVMTEVM